MAGVDLSRHENWKRGVLNPIHFIPHLVSARTRIHFELAPVFHVGKTTHVLPVQPSVRSCRRYERLHRGTAPYSYKSIDQPVNNTGITRTYRLIHHWMESAVPLRKEK